MLRLTVSTEEYLMIGDDIKIVTMPPVAAQMMMKAVDFLLLVPYPSDLLYPYS
ncbi:MAG: carbon storage regulator, partial [Lachnospiraceae bacterium]|nr:carbon storage regulator [Lachnospiraceae bacterium]